MNKGELIGAVNALGLTEEKIGENTSATKADLQSVLDAADGVAPILAKNIILVDENAAQAKDLEEAVDSIDKLSSANESLAASSADTILQYNDKAYAVQSGIRFNGKVYTKADIAKNVTVSGEEFETIADFVLSQEGQETLILKD